MRKPAWKSVAIAGSAGAVILGSGAAALAATGSGPSGAGASGAAGAGRGRAAKVLGRGLHGTWVTADPKNAGTYVQHDAIRGEVTDVSATSITVKAVDGVSMTFVVDASSKVKVAGGTTIGDVHDADRVAVVGTGTTTLTATHVVGARAAGAGKASKPTS
jgi:hypothetical protein